MASSRRGWAAAAPNGLRRAASPWPPPRAAPRHAAPGRGRGGSNRIRSAVLQTIIRVIADGMDAQEAVSAPRVHFEAGAVQAEPGVDEGGLDGLATRGYQLVHWQERNLFFGGVHAVARADTGE